MDLNQVTLYCTELNRSIIFYQTLGLKLIVKNDHYARFEMAGSSTFSLEVKATVQAGDAKICFEVPDIQKSEKLLKELNVKFEGPIDQSWLWKEIHLRDPDSHHLCIFEAGENRKNPPWKI